MFVLYAEIYVFCILLLGILLVQLLESGDKRAHQRLFVRVLLLIMFVTVLDLLWSSLQFHVLEVDSPAFGWLVNGVYFTAAGFCGYEWVLYSECIQKSRWYLDGKLRRLCALPAVLQMTLAMTAYWNRLLFFIDSDGSYHRGGMYLVYLLLNYLPCFLTTFRALYCSYRVKDYTARREMRALAGFMIAPFITLSLQIAWPQLPAVCVGLTVACLMVFLKMKESQMFTDSLTGLNNRFRLDMYLASQMEEYRQPRVGKRLYLLFMDVDRFKTINDVYGHVEGDEALRRVADVLKSVCRETNAFIGRYGGDEFAVICESESPVAADAAAEAINRSLEQAFQGLPYRLRVSVGVAEYSAFYRTPQEFIRAADRRLYEAKGRR